MSENLIELGRVIDILNERGYDADIFDLKQKVVNGEIHGKRIGSYWHIEEKSLDKLPIILGLTPPKPLLPREKRPEEKKSVRKSNDFFFTQTDHGNKELLESVFSDYIGKEVHLFDSPFHNIVYLLDMDIDESIIKDDWKFVSFEDLLYWLHPKETERGYQQETEWLIEGIKAYRELEDEMKLKIAALRENNVHNDINFVYDLDRMDVELPRDILVSAALYALSDNHEFFSIYKERERVNTLVDFKKLAYALELSNRIRSNPKLKNRIFQIFQEKRNYSEFFDMMESEAAKEVGEGIKKKVSGTEKRDLTTYALLFVIKDQNPDLNLKREQKKYTWTMGSFERMKRFKKQKRAFYDEALTRILDTLDKSSIENEVDIGLFLANSLRDKTFDFFYKHYSGRGIAFSTFVKYCATVLYLEGKENHDPRLKKYGDVLIRLEESGEVKNIDRLMGRTGRTCLVDLIIEKNHDSRLVEEIIKENWVDYQKVLGRQGCWKDRTRSTPFNQDEIVYMCDFLKRFGNYEGVFPK